MNNLHFTSGSSCIHHSHAQRLRGTPKRTVASAIALATALSCHTSAWSGSAAGEVELDTVKVTAPKAVVGSLPKNLPANSAGYSAQEINEQVNVINTEDIVKYSPDTMTRKRYVGDRNAIIETRTASVTASARSLVYADGFLLSNLLGNSYSFPPRWAMVMPEEIQRVDFFFGPHSAAFPGNSTGTTVLMTTRMPEKFEVVGKVQLFSENFDQYGHGGTYGGQSVSAMVGNKKDNMSWLLGFNHLDSKGHPMNYALATKGGAGTQTATGMVSDTDPNGTPRFIVGETSQETTHQDSIKAKVAFDFPGSWKATYEFGAWLNDSFNHTASYLRDANGNAINKGAFLVGGQSYTIGANAFSENVWRQSHWMNALSVRSNTHGEWDTEVVLTSYDIGKDLQNVSQPTGLKDASGVTHYGTVQQNPYGDGWTTFDARGTWRPQGSAAARLHEVNMGYHIDDYRLNSKTWFSNPAQGGTDWAYAGPTNVLNSASQGVTQTQAVYMQDAWRFAPQWKFTPGLRLEQWRAFDGANQKIGGTPSTVQTASYPNQNKAFSSPKLALQYAVNEDWLIKGALSRAYRLPTVTELYQAVTVGNALTNANPTLLPEQVTASELTAERLLPDGLLRASVFTESVHHAIYKANAVTPTGATVSATTNLDKVETYGFTMAYQQANVVLRGLDLTGSLTYAHARTVADALNPSFVGKVFPGIPNWRATAVGTYHFNDKINWTLAARYSGRQYNTADNIDTNPDVFGSNSRFFVVDTRMTWALDKQYQLALGVDNLNNDKYYAYHPMPQRTVHAELKAKF